MPKNLFIVPMIPGDGTWADPRRPKYVDDAAVTRWGSVRYSHVDDAIVLIDAPNAYLNQVAGEADVVRIATAANIDNTLNASQAANIRDFLSTRDIPVQFVNAGDTRRQVIRGIVGMFLFSQRMEGRFGEGFRQKFRNRGMTLDSVWTDFPQALKDEFIDVRDSWGWTNTELGVTNTSTLREIMGAISTQFEGTPFVINSVEI